MQGHRKIDRGGRAVGGSRSRPGCSASSGGDDDGGDGGVWKEFVHDGLDPNDATIDLEGDPYFYRSLDGSLTVWRVRRAPEACMIQLVGDCSEPWIAELCGDLLGDEVVGAEVGWYPVTGLLGWTGPPGMQKIESQNDDDDEAMGANPMQPRALPIMDIMRPVPLQPRAKPMPKTAKQRQALRLLVPKSKAKAKPKAKAKRSPTPPWRQRAPRGARY